MKTGISNIFTRYFITFSSIFLVALLALGTTLILLVNTFSIHEKTDLLKENTSNIAGGISETLIINDMNSAYSTQKAAICSSLATVSNCISSDVFVCDVEGNVILCKEQLGTAAYRSNKMVCDEHASFKVDDELLMRVYENGTAYTKAVVNGKSSYVVGTAIVAPKYSQGNSEGADNIIGTVFAPVEEGTTALVMSLIRTFVIVAVIVPLILLAISGAVAFFALSTEFFVLNPFTLLLPVLLGLCIIDFLALTMIYRKK